MKTLGLVLLSGFGLTLAGCYLAPATVEGLNQVFYEFDPADQHRCRDVYPLDVVALLPEEAERFGGPGSVFLNDRRTYDLESLWDYVCSGEVDLKRTGPELVFDSSDGSAGYLGRPFIEVVPLLPVARANDPSIEIEEGPFSFYREARMRESSLRTSVEWLLPEALTSLDADIEFFGADRSGPGGYAIYGPDIFGLERPEDQGRESYRLDYEIRFESWPRSLQCFEIGFQEIGCQGLPVEGAEAFPAITFSGEMVRIPPPSDSP